MANEMIETIEDMERLYYTDRGASLLYNGEYDLAKSDAPVISTTTGVYNPVYGAQAWIQFNQEANTAGVLPKSVHKQSGWRAITARSTTLPYGGRSETAVLPDTIKPTFQEVSAKPKIIAVTFGNSELQEFLAKSGDDAIGALEDLRVFMGGEHREDMNVQLNTQNGTLAGNNLESVDRVVASFGELSFTEADQSTSYTAGDLDIYGLDRDGGASWADAYVSGANASLRSLSDPLLQALVQNTLANGANPDGQFLQTGWDSWSVINQLYDAQVRYNLIGTAMIRPGVNGIQAHQGQGVGLSVAKYQHMIVILSKNTVVDTGGISRVYALDTSNPEGFDLPRLSLRVAKPTQYFEAGMNDGNPFVVNQFGTKGLYRTMLETICTMFKAQGKLRDLKA